MATETYAIYLKSAAQLRECSGFAVEPSFQTRPGQSPSSVTLYTVVAQAIATGQRKIVAEFPFELHAVIFRDMAKATATARLL